MAKLVLVPKVDAPKASRISKRVNAISRSTFLQCACDSRSPSTPSAIASSETTRKTNLFSSWLHEWGDNYLDTRRDAVRQQVLLETVKKLATERAALEAEQKLVRERAAPLPAMTASAATAPAATTSTSIAEPPASSDDDIAWIWPTAGPVLAGFDEVKMKGLDKVDQMVRKGQKIAEMGSSDADRVKLSFELRRHGKPVDPSKYFPPR
jgi:septal ring factor EnvC (AmiA/AmiB activator)